MIYSYVPSSVKVTLFGITMESLAKDDFITIERSDNASTYRKAQDGTRTAFIDRFGTYRVTINFSQVSESNEVVHLLFKLYQKSGVNLKMPLIIEEKSNEGGTSFISLDTFFETEATTQFTSDTVPKSWVFICHNASYTQKGTRTSFELADTLQSIVTLLELSEQFDIDLNSIKDRLSDTVEFASAKLKDLF